MANYELQKMIEEHRTIIRTAELGGLNNEPVYTQKEVDDKIEKVLRISENLEK